MNETGGKKTTIRRYLVPKQSSFGTDSFDAFWWQMFLAKMWCSAQKVWHNMGGKILRGTNTVLLRKFVKYGLKSFITSGPEFIK